MNDLENLSISALSALMGDGKISPGELAKYFRSRAEQSSDLNAYLRLCDIDTMPVGKLAGIPIAHKDIFCAKGEITSCGSKILSRFRSPYDSAVVEKCKQAGMVTIGRTNMDEFAMGSSGENSAFGLSKNPWDKKRTPGGSSSGSAVAVAARTVPVATATDTGGSIRQPAAFCGITGIKPTYGRVSRWGMVAFASSFDQAGILAKNAEDCAVSLSVIAGFDERDSTSSNRPDEDFTQKLSTSVSGKKIGIPQEYFSDGLNNEVASRVQEAAKLFEKNGATLVDVSLPSSRYAVSAYYILTCAEASSNLSRYDGIRYGERVDQKNLNDLYVQSRTKGFGAEVKRRILIGTYVLSYGYYDAYFRKAMRIRKIIADDFANAFKQCDLILGPTTPDVAFLLDSIKKDDPVSMYLQDIYTVPSNLAGLPAMSLPCGFAANMPVGLQLIGQAFDESTLLSVAHQYQQFTDFHQQMPPNIT